MNQKKAIAVKKDLLFGSIGALSSLFLIFITNPTSLPMLVVLSFPVIFTVSSFYFSRVFLRVFFEMSDQSMKILSSAFSGGFMLVFLLGSLKQLGMQDFILAALLVSGLGFYFLTRQQSLAGDMPRPPLD